MGDRRYTFNPLASSFSTASARTATMEPLTPIKNKYMLFSGWEVRMVKNCDRGLENAALGLRPRAVVCRS